MSVSASAVNGSSGCCSVRGCLVFKVLHVVPVVLTVLVDLSRFSFFVWFSWLSWLSVVRSCTVLRVSWFVLGALMILVALVVLVIF